MNSNQQKVISYHGLTLNLASVKCFKLPLPIDKSKEVTMVVEFKTRYDFIKNPQTGEWEKQEFNETTEMTFPDYESAKTFRNEWQSFWNEYLLEE